MAAGSNVGYNFLGKSGLKVSNICLGTLTFGMSKGSLAVFECSTQLDEEKSHQILDRYVELGGNFLDTANIYTGGKSEEIIGNWLQKTQRDRIVVATKCRFPVDTSDVNNVGLSRRHIVQSVEESLARLKTNYIDIMQTHAWDNAVPVEETMRTFDDLVRCGSPSHKALTDWKLRYVHDTTGVDLDLPVHGVMRDMFSTVYYWQQYNLLCRQSEWEEFMVCKNEGIGVLPWSPLKGGLLTGKFKRGETPDKTKSRIGFIHTDEKRAVQSAPAWSNYSENDVYWNLVDVMDKIAAARGKSIPQVAIRWLLQQDVVASVIIGATSLKQLDDNMGASAGWELSKEEVAQLDAASPRMSYYPYEMIWRVNGPDRFNKLNRSIQI